VKVQVMSDRNHQTDHGARAGAGPRAVIGLMVSITHHLDLH